MTGLAQPAHDQGGAPRQAQDDDKRRVVLVGRLERRDFRFTEPMFQHSLSLTLTHADDTESVLVYGRDILIDLEIDALADLLEKRRG